MKLELFYFESCPFCRLVLKYLEDKKNNIVFKDIRKNSEYKNELKGLSGKTQVPCLVIDRKPMFESLDILNYLKENKELWVA